MKGTISKYVLTDGRTQRWRIAVDLGRQPAQRCDACSKSWWLDGRPHKACPTCGGGLIVHDERRRVFQRGFTRRRDAEQAARDLIGTVERGAVVGPTRQTTGQYLRSWLEGIRRKPTTLAQYRQAIDVHLLNARHGIGGIPLVALAPEHIDRLYRHLEAAGRRDGTGGLAPKSVRIVHTVLRKALQDALERGYVLRNVADLANPPTSKDARSRNARDRIWTRAQLKAFLDFVAADRLQAAWWLLSTTGLRRGELCGLRWDDVDLDAGTINVRTTRTTVGSQVIEQRSGKSDAAERTFAVDPATIAVLRDHRRRQLEERLMIGAAWSDTGFLFVDVLGEPLKPDAIYRRFVVLARHAGLPRIDIHGLRHSYATAARQAGIDAEVLARRLGHADVAITLGLYRHVGVEDDAEAAARAAAAILGL